jgi:hypothetical protein
VAAVPDLADQLSKLTAHCNKLAGKREMLMGQLKEHGFDSVEAAEAQLEKDQKEISDAEIKLSAEYNKFVAEYGVALKALGIKI